MTPRVQQLLPSIVSETQMHHGCKSVHDSCTVFGWRSVAHAAGSSRRRPASPRRGSSLVGRRSALSLARPRSSSGLPTRAAKRPRRSVSAAQPSSGVCCPTSTTVEMPWGAKLIPVDELERLLAEQRRAAKPRPVPPARGRPPLLPAEVIERIRTERAEGASLHLIAAGLNADGIPTAHGGKQWWPSTIRSALTRTRPPSPAPRSL